MRSQRSPFVYKLPGKDNDLPNAQIRITDFDMAKINTLLIHRVITRSCNCPHKQNDTEFYMFEYRDGGMSIDFSKKGCKGKGVIYLDLNGKPKSIDCLVECENV